MGYVQRTTLLPACSDAMSSFDAAARSAFETMMGRQLSELQRKQLVAPFRHAGLGLRSALDTADEAYCASLLSTRALRQTLYPGVDGACEQVVERINAALPIDDRICIPGVDEPMISQQQLGRKLAVARASQLAEVLPPVHRARLHLFSAPRAGRWFNAAPSSTLDKHLTSRDLSIFRYLLVGVDVFDESCICRFCGAVSDTSGIHALSCTASGDIVLRHHDVRDIRLFVRRRFRINAFPLVL